MIDARAIWVNPAGLAVRPLASIHLDLAVDQPGERGRLGQITAGFSSRGFGFSYQRDPLDTGLVAHTYRVGLAGASGGFAAGVAAAYYRGGTKSTGWDAGIVFTPAPVLAIGGNVSNISHPGVRGQELPLTMLAGATVAPLNQRLALSAQAAFTSDSVLGYGFGTRWTLPVGIPLTLLARYDTDRQLRGTAWAFGLSAGLQTIAGAVVSTPGDLGTPDAASFYGVVSRPLDR